MLIIPKKSQMRGVVFKYEQTKRKIRSSIISNF